MVVYIASSSRSSSGVGSGLTIVGAGRVIGASSDQCVESAPRLLLGGRGHSMNSAGRNRSMAQARALADCWSFRTG
ncbi:Uncharacterised protein [Mycobacteroides abscessus subsp. abscessus]|nr:Uncharacterised protein [Mycobacteroides abscessus subsp. abscessus]